MNCSSTNVCKDFNRPMMTDDCHCKTFNGCHCENTDDCESLFSDGPIPFRFKENVLWFLKIAGFLFLKTICMVETGLSYIQNYKYKTITDTNLEPFELIIQYFVLLIKKIQIRINTFYMYGNADLVFITQIILCFIQQIKKIMETKSWKIKLERTIFLLIQVIMMYFFTAIMMNLFTSIIRSFIKNVVIQNILKLICFIYKHVFQLDFIYL